MFKFSHFTLFLICLKETRPCLPKFFIDLYLGNLELYFSKLLYTLYLPRSAFFKCYNLLSSILSTASDSPNCN